jgi:hypothetical protein
LKADEGRNPMDIRPLGAYAAMTKAYRGTQLIEEARRTRNGGVSYARFHGINITVWIISHALEPTVAQGKARSSPPAYWTLFRFIGRF